jgi:hypothetical protein
VKTAPSRNSGAAHPVALIAHPATPGKAVRRIEVQVDRPAPATLELHYRVEGDIGSLLIPAASTARRADQLWRHTCFEAFIAVPGTGGYFEFNFSPSTQWAVYRFLAYREGMAAIEAARAPRISVQHEHGRLGLDASVDLEPLPALRDSPGLRLALAAVVEEQDKGLSYWALAHAPGKPDFHHADGFVLTLARDGAGEDSLSPRGSGRG